MNVKYTIFVDKAVWSQHEENTSLTELTRRLPEGYIIYESDCDGFDTPWFNENDLGIQPEDVDPVLKMLVLMLGL